MALALARFKPSTVNSTVVPRAMPTGDTLFNVGGVVRSPVGRSLLAAERVRARRETSIGFIWLWSGYRRSGRWRRFFRWGQTAGRRPNPAPATIAVRSNLGRGKL